MDIKALKVENWNKYINICKAKKLTLPTSKEFIDSAPTNFAISSFIFNFAINYTKEFNTLIYSKKLFCMNSDYHKTYYANCLDLIKNIQDQNAFNSVIRTYRYQELIRIAWQHFSFKKKFEDTSKELSALADNLISITHDFHFESLKKIYFLNANTPPMIILGMGKLGAKELNFSSDIDLIFLYQSDQITMPKAITPLRLYTKLGQKIINSLHQLQPNGFVYRVDMRLRPFGDSGPLCTSLKSFNNYCIKHGREWERYAMIKARCITGNPSCQVLTDNIINNFVYRPYNDYKAIDSIREMKQKIQIEMKKSKNNIKLGSGGIREIEFIAQCFQLIYGESNTPLATRELKSALYVLTNLNIISNKHTSELYTHYVFLRNVENSLQMLSDQQIHTLPKNITTQEALTAALKYPNWSSLKEKIDSTLKKNSEIFHYLTNFSTHNKKIDLKTTHRNENLNIVTPSINTPINIINKFKQTLQLHQYSQEAIELIEHLLPTIQINIITHKEWQQVYTTNKALCFIKKIARRPTYLYLLKEREANIIDWLKLLQLGTYFSNTLENHPFLLERILITNHRRTPINYSSALNSILKNIDMHNKESLMETMRRFLLTELFSIAINYSIGHLKIMKSSDSMSLLAEVIINKTLEQAWEEVIIKNNIGINITHELKKSLSIISYGKLGGYEMGFGSDIDIIFLYIDRPHTKKYIHLFIKTAQKFVSLMQAYTYSGKLYDIDMRLRPEGTSGLLVSSIMSFKTYQEKSAWTWEHQALVRARIITKNKDMVSIFNKIRLSVLGKDRPHIQLQKDICSMRKKILTHQKISPNTFSIKHSVGGMIDIEFLAQYFVLKHASRHNAIALFTDNIRIFESMESAQYLSKTDAETLITTYCHYRSLIYSFHFQDKPAIIEYNKIQDYSNNIIKIWREHMESVNGEKDD